MVTPASRQSLLDSIQKLRGRRRPVREVPVAVQAIMPRVTEKPVFKEWDDVAKRRSLVLDGLTGRHYGDTEKFLMERLTILHTERPIYSGEPRGELFIHWFYVDRTEQRLSACEIFHLNMLSHFNAMDRLEVIHVRCACKGNHLTPAMEQAIGILSSGKASVDFKVVPCTKGWEHDTFKECVEYAVDSGKFVYYTHFKGVTHIVDGILRCTYRNKNTKITPINIMYWCYAMYRYLFKDAPADARAIGPFLYHRRPTLHYVNRNITPKWSLPVKGHYTGSFQAFDGKFLRDRFTELGATREIRERTLWISDPYTVEQFLTLCFRWDEVSTATRVGGAYQMYDQNVLPAYRKDFVGLYAEENRNICVANGTYKWIGGTDTFNWALCKALVDMGYSVYYYAPDMDGKGVTERYLQEIGVKPYVDGIPLLACFANQQSGKHFVGRCPVVQTCHSAYTDLELPIKGALAYVSISEEIQTRLQVRGFQTGIIRNGIDLERYCPRTPLKENPSVLSICQGDDTMLREACDRLGWPFHSVPKEVGSRIWHVEDLINQADIVVGIGRSLYDGMACGRACLSWDNRRLNPYSGCGYVTKGDWYKFARTNFTGRGFAPINTVDGLVRELSKYRVSDGADMREMAERELDMRKNAARYLELAGVRKI